ncbi:MAG TPA: hypothetical protein VGG85_04220 [Terracidiphilus sp.]|jgi:hypothetical protein
MKIRNYFHLTKDALRIIAVVVSIALTLTWSVAAGITAACTQSAAPFRPQNRSKSMLQPARNEMRRPHLKDGDRYQNWVEFKIVDGLMQIMERAI